MQEPTAITAGQTLFYDLAPGATNIRGGAPTFQETLPIPAPLFTTGLGFDIKTTTVNIQPGDQWAVISIGTEEWFIL